METLVKYGADGETPDIRRAALRCVANALLLDPKMRQIFVDTGYGGKIAERLKVRMRSSSRPCTLGLMLTARVRPIIQRTKW